MTLESWRWKDPAKVYERIEGMNAARKPKPPTAREQLESLFGDVNMGRKLDIPPRVTQVCFAWGQWERRRNLWADLRVTPFCKLLGIGGSGPEPIVRLDPESHQIHRAYYAIRDEKTQIVLFAYYVGSLQWDDRRKSFERIGISSTTFYRLLRIGSLRLYNASGLAADDRKTTA